MCSLYHPMPRCFPCRSTRYGIIHRSSIGHSDADVWGFPGVHLGVVPGSRRRQRCGMGDLVVGLWWYGGDACVLLVGPPTHDLQNGPPSGHHVRVRFGDVLLLVSVAFTHRVRPLSRRWNAHEPSIVGVTRCRLSHAIRNQHLFCVVDGDPKTNAKAMDVSPARRSTSNDQSRHHDGWNVVI